MSERSDEELVVAAKAGDERALEQLLSRHEKQVYRFGLRMCGSEEEAKEVLQETLLTAFRTLHTFRGEAQLSTWLYQVARTHCFRTRRQRAGALRAVEPLDSPAAKSIPSAQSKPDEVSHARQMGEILHVAILALPETYREALVLRDVEGLSGEEAARVVGIEERAFKSRLHRARLQLRSHLAALLREGHEGQGPHCPDLAQELSLFPSEEIDQATCIRIEDHLARCPHCAAECEALKRTVSLCRRIPGDAVPALVRAAVRQALRGAVLG